MGCVYCARCDKVIDLDYNTEDVVTNENIPGLTENDWDWVCRDCLTEEELEILEDNE